MSLRALLIHLQLFFFCWYLVDNLYREILEMLITYIEKYRCWQNKGHVMPMYYDMSYNTWEPCTVTWEPCTVNGPCTMTCHSTWLACPMNYDGSHSSWSMLKGKEIPMLAIQRPLALHDFHKHISLHSRPFSKIAYFA